LFWGAKFAKITFRLTRLPWLWLERLWRHLAEKNERRKEEILAGLDRDLAAAQSTLVGEIEKEAEAFKDGAPLDLRTRSPRDPQTIFRHKIKMEAGRDEGRYDIIGGAFGFVYEETHRFKFFECARYEDIRQSKSFNTLLKTLGEYGSVKIEWQGQNEDDRFSDNPPDRSFDDFKDAFQSEGKLRCILRNLTIEVDVTQDYDAKA
jgi:hypothetical protein